MKTVRALPLLLLPLLAGAHGAHEHGIGQLDLVVDGDLIQAELSGPGHNFVGFERAPRDASERAAVADARERLQQGASLLGLPEAARCIRQDFHLEGVPDDAHQHTESGDLHGDWRVRWRYRCELPNALRQLELGLFDAFPHTGELRWQLVVGSFQDGGRASAAAPRIGLLPPR
jgi:hypothetical protein